LAQYLARPERALWIFFACVSVPLAFGASCSAQCQQTAAKTALDVGSCALQAVASAAAGLLGTVSNLLIGATNDDQAIASLKLMAVTYGAPAVTCAIDRVVTDLGGDPTAVPPVAVSAAEETPVSRAIRRGQLARTQINTL
jgi:hypothetical protein